MTRTLLVPTYRLTFPIVVDGQTHQIHLWLPVAASGADASGYQTVPRTGHSATGLSNVTTPLWNILAPLYQATKSAFGPAHLDHLSSGSWIPLWYEASSPAASASAAYAPANIMTISGYTSNHVKTKFVFEETINSVPFRSTTAAGAGAAFTALLNTLFNTSASAGDTAPWAWSVGRDGLYFQTLISIVAAFSKHWRRKRGMG